MRLIDDKDEQFLDNRSGAAICALMSTRLSGLRDRDGHLCCNGQDCKPVKATVLPDGSYYLPETGEIIPADVATPSPDDRFHHCTAYQLGPIASEFDRWLI